MVVFVGKKSVLFSHTMTKQISDESLANFKRQALGVPQTLVADVTCNYTTSSGDTLYEKVLVGYKPILFPTACSENCCFDYRFTVRDLILPTTLPEVTGLYFKDIVAKMQDMFTQTTSGDAIVSGKVLSYMPYCTILAQDENGIELQDYVVDKDTTYKVINSNRLVQRESCAVFTVNSNLKMEKTVDLESQSNAYKLLAIREQYDDEGKLLRRFLESTNCASPQDLKDIQEEPAAEVETRKGRIICIDIILCDILVFCKRTFDFLQPSLESIKELKPRAKSEVPLGWLSAEEKFQKMLQKKNGKEGTNMTRKLPNDIFYYVDMTSKIDQIIASSSPADIVFVDNNKLITPFVNHYAYALQISNCRVYAK